MTSSSSSTWNFSRTRRFITNVQVRGEADGEIRVSANFMVTRARKGQTDTYVGRYDHVLKADPTGGFEQIKQIDLSAQWPVSERWTLIGRWNYSIADRDLKEIFAKFLDERSRLSGGSAMTQQRKDELFDQFQRWQQQQATRR